MIKYILTAWLIIISFAVFAQTVTIEPKNFTALDEITITVDVTGNAKLESLGDNAFLWLWVPGGVGAKTNVNPFSTIVPSAEIPDPSVAKFTKTGPNLYSVSLTLSSFLGVAPGAITRIGVILKGNDWGDGQTSDAFFDVAPLEYIPRVNRVFPSQLTSADVITVYLEQKLATNVEVQRMKDVKVSIELFSGNESIAKTTEPLPAINEGNGIYSYTFIADRLFTVPAGKKITKFKYKFSGTGKDATGKDETVTSDEYEKEFTEIN